MLGGLDGDVSEQELNLVELSTGKMAKLAQVRRKSCGASFGMSARAAATFTISQSTLGVIPVPQTRPLLSIDRNRAPSMIPLASVHFSTAVFTQLGIGTVRM